MKVFLRIVTMCALLVFVVLLFPVLVKLFTPWHEAWYDLSEAENQRLLDAWSAMDKGDALDLDEKFMFGESPVLAWSRRDFEKSPEGIERAFYKTVVAVYSSSKSTKMPKFENVRVRTCEDADWTDLSACGKYKILTDGGWTVSYYSVRLPDRFEPRDGANVHVQVVVSVDENPDGGDVECLTTKTFSYVFIPQIRSGRCELLHWFTNL